MSMTPGSVTVNDDESHTGSGAALAVYEALKAAHAPDMPSTAPYDAFPWVDDGDKKATMTPANRQAALDGVKAARVKMLRRDAGDATAIGATMVAYIQANARVPLANVKATVSDATSVGKLPATLTPGDPIDPPDPAVDLPVTGDAGATELPIT